MMAPWAWGTISAVCFVGCVALTGVAAYGSGEASVDPIATLPGLAASVAEPGTAGAAVPTPKEDAPLTGCPSADTTRHVTT